MIFRKPWSFIGEIDCFYIMQYYFVSIVYPYINVKRKMLFFLLDPIQDLFYFLFK
jgi:hypothetical protein